MNDHIIQARGVGKVYRTAKLEVHALRGVDLQVRRGEMVAIMGPSSPSEDWLAGLAHRLGQTATTIVAGCSH